MINKMEKRAGSVEVCAAWKYRKTFITLKFKTQFSL